jgi:hypothetical protein
LFSQVAANEQSALANNSFKNDIYQRSLAVERDSDESDEEISDDQFAITNQTSELATSMTEINNNSTSKEIRFEDYKREKSEIQTVQEEPYEEDSDENEEVHVCKLVITVVAGFPGGKQFQII